MKKTLSLLLSLVLMLSLALPASAAETEYPTLEGGVTEIQKYGNIVLDIDPADLKDGGYTYGDLLTVTVNGTGYDMPLCTNYSDVDTGALVLRDSEGVLIAAINMGDFATSNGLAAKVTAEDGSYTWEFPEGQSLESITVSISMKEQGGYYDQYLIHQLTRTDERADYASDAVFANFRNVAVGDLGENAFFRSSSPVNNELGRASYADGRRHPGGHEPGGFQRADRGLHRRRGLRLPLLPVSVRGGEGEGPEPGRGLHRCRLQVRPGGGPALLRGE